MLHIVAKRWFQKSYGNTYHSVTVYQDNEEIARVPFAYGYDDQWIETAGKAAGRNFLTRRDLREAGVTFQVEDVKRRGEL